MEISRVIALSFEPYKEFYTTEAFAATVVNREILEKRMENTNTPVFVARNDYRIIGTASVKPVKKNILYIGTMAIHPNYLRQGIGTMLLNHIEKYAMKKGFKYLILETYKYLESAINLYQKFGFTETGNERDYFGVRIFEMQKTLIG